MVRHLLRRPFWLLRLEDRITPVVITVSNTLNSGTGSLRQAIFTANFISGSDSIVFDSSFSSAKIITLTTGEMAINEGVTITGPGAGLLTISGNAASRIFNTSAVGATNAVTLSGLTLASCLTSGDGGALLVNDEVVTLTGCNLINNIAIGDGGAFSAAGTATITFTDCNFTGNQANTGAGAVHLPAGGTLTVERCTLANNVAVNSAGGAISVAGTATTAITIRNSTLSANTAGTSGGGVAFAPTKGILTVRNSTLTLNKATSGLGGGIARTAGGGVINIESTIVSGNINSNPPNPNTITPDISSAGTVNVNFSAVSSNSGFTLTGANNLGFITVPLGALADNGGLTKTHLPAPGNLVVDKGANTTGLTTDQRGNGYLRQRTPGVDIGAVEAPTDLLVMNSADSGFGSLRQAVIDANYAIGTDTIVFDTGAFTFGKIITLTSGELLITQPLALLGFGSGYVTVSGNNSSRVIQIAGAVNQSETTIAGLTITGGSAIQGAGILAQTRVLVRDCVITGNKALNGAGGGIALFGEYGTFQNCVITNNTASQGGGIAALGVDQSLTLRSCTVSGNSAERGGGLFLRPSEILSLLVEDCAVSGNVATKTGGGGIEAYVPNTKTGMVTVRSSTVSQNQAMSDGGGILTSRQVVLIQNSTIVGNSSGTNGGGLCELSGDVITIESSIVSGNTATAGPDVFKPGGITKGYTSAFGNSNGFTLNISSNNLPFALDLKLGPLADNGGLTKTHKPASDSPLIDQGGSTTIAFDQRGTGYPRSMGSASDIGAVEFKDLTVYNANDSGVGSLRAAIANSFATVGKNETITFEPTYFSTPRLITLTTGTLHVNEALTITSPGSDLVTVSGNNAVTVFSLVSFAGTITISGLTIRDGNGGNGGGIFAAGKIAIDHSVITKNLGFYGGGIYAAALAELNLTACTISSNTAKADGGGLVMWEDGNLLVEGCTISGNSATDGGGVYLWGQDGKSTFTIRNSTISSNTASKDGGGIIALYPMFPFEDLIIQNCTLVNNSAGGTGGGIALTKDYGILRITSSIIAGNTAVSAADIRSIPSVAMTLCAVGTLSGFVPSGGGNYFGLDYKLGPLANNGGPTLTHALAIGSVCINNGGNPAMLSSDQRGAGFLRVSGPLSDIGAYEFQYLPAKVTSVQINDGSPQRSRVTSLTLSFDQPPSLPLNLSSAFELRRQTDTALVSLNASLTGNAVTLTFVNGPVESSSLADGRYTLRILASVMTNLDGNGNGTPGDDYLLIGNPANNGLFRLFGDADGDGTVAASDFIQFRFAFGGINPIFDFDNDGAVAASDFIQFRLRFGGSI